MHYILFQWFWCLYGLSQNPLAYIVSFSFNILAFSSTSCGSRSPSLACNPRVPMPWWLYKVAFFLICSHMMILLVKFRSKVALKSKEKKPLEKFVYENYFVEKNVVRAGVWGNVREHSREHTSLNVKRWVFFRKCKSMISQFRRTLAHIPRVSQFGRTLIYILASTCLGDPLHRWEKIVRSLYVVS